MPDIRAAIQGARSQVAGGAGLPPRLQAAIAAGRMSPGQAQQRFGQFQAGTLPGQGGGGASPPIAELPGGRGGPQVDPLPGQGPMVEDVARAQPATPIGGTMHPAEQISSVTGGGLEAQPGAGMSPFTKPMIRPVGPQVQPYGPPPEVSQPLPNAPGLDVFPGQDQPMGVAQKPQPYSELALKKGDEMGGGAPGAVTKPAVRPDLSAPMPAGAAAGGLSGPPPPPGKGEGPSSGFWGGGGGPQIMAMPSQGGAKGRLAATRGVLRNALRPRGGSRPASLSGM